MIEVAQCAGCPAPRAAWPDALHLLLQWAGWQELGVEISLPLLSFDDDSTHSQLKQGMRQCDPPWSAAVVFALSC